MSSADPDARRDSDRAADAPEFFHETQDRMAYLPNYYAWICSRFRDHLSGRVLELGCGAGFVLRNYVDRVERVVAVDVDPGLLERLAAAYPPDKVRTLRVDLGGDWRELEGVEADVIVALDVLEHFRDDAAFVRKLRRHLAPGGKVVLKVPAQSRLFGEIDRASGHFRRYDEEQLHALMEAQGFRTLALRPMNPAGAWGYRLKRGRHASYSQTFSPAKLKLVNALIPALSLLDRVPGLKGLSLVGVFAS